MLTTLEPETAIANQAVCILPDEFDMTDERWAIIIDHWNSNGRQLIDADDVALLFTADHCAR